MLARVTTFAIDGLDPRRVTVEVDIRAAACRRSRSSASATRPCASRASACRPRSSTPASSSRAKRITVNLAPASSAQGRPGLRPARLACALLVGQRAGAAGGARALGGLRRARRWRASCARAAACSPCAEGARRAGLARPRRPASRARARRRSSRGSRSSASTRCRRRSTSCAARAQPRAAADGARRPRCGAAGARPGRRPRPHRARSARSTVAAAGGHNLLFPARPAPARRCSRGACRRSCRR